MNTLNPTRSGRRVLAAIVTAAAAAGVVGAWGASQASAEPEGTSADVLLQESDNRYLATTPEGGAALVAPSDPSLMNRWYLDPQENAGQYLLRNDAQTDGRDVCLQVPSAESVSVDLCDPANPGQVLDLTHLGQEHYTLHAAEGFVAVDADGSLTTTTDPAGALVLQATYPAGNQVR